MVALILLAIAAAALGALDLRRHREESDRRRRLRQAAGLPPGFGGPTSRMARTRAG
ncbi:MAG: hypothetical protein WCB85_14040 [Candidatus Dormiibacterota bacterium]